MAEWLQQLESNDPRIVEDVKQKFHEQFNIVKDPWLLNGIYDYYLQTNSVRSMEILIDVREQHHQYLFDKISESIKQGSKNDTKVQSLILLGHVVRKQPTWLFKITQHSVFKDILKLLKCESDILPLLSALLVLIVLLPIIPSNIGQSLQDIFEIFSRLAAWKCNNPGKIVEEQMVHMQVALYALFQRLYGMYPCNFLAYLRTNYRNKEALPIFIHTVRPMLDSVRMHPLLVTTVKDSETTNERWKKMSPHDVIVECERFSIDGSDRCQHETCLIPPTFRSRSGTTNSTTFESPYLDVLFKSTPISNLMFERDFFSPSNMIINSHTPPVNESIPTAIPHAHLPLPGVGQSLVCSVNLQSQEGTSPPEAAIEATPETTPIKDLRVLSARQQPQSSSVARALNSFSARNWSVGGSANTTPTQSQPSSPMRKDASSFNFQPSDTSKYTSAFGLPKREPYYTNLKIQMIAQDRSQISESVFERTKLILPPTSPLRIIPPSCSSENSIPNSPLPMQRIDSPVSQEDEEVLAIVRQGEFTKHPNLRQCDSVLHEVDGGCRGTEDEADDCEKGSPCTSGGLHMPNTKQMMVFQSKMKRLRYHSQCGPDGEQFDVAASTGTSPANVPSTTNLTVRRANSCPEIKKSPVIPTKDNINKTLEERDEESLISDNHQNITNGFDCNELKKERVNKKLSTTETQTENFWPMPYEHLFLSIFPSIENSEIKPSPVPSPAPFNVQLDKYAPPLSVYDILDRYIEIAAHSNERDAMRNLKDQLLLMNQQLLFERHRRETHALRNRTLFTDVRKHRILDEHKTALTDQVKLMEDHMDLLKSQIDGYRKNEHCREKEALDNANYWETKFKDIQNECMIMKETNEDLQNALDIEKSKVLELDKKWQSGEALLLDAETEVRIAREQVWAGEKCRAELEQSNRELTLAGELIQKYKERLNDLNLLRRSEQEQAKCAEAYQHEIRNIQQQLDSKVTALDACKTRITELEQSLLQNDELSTVQKRILNDVKEECHEKIKVVEMKYQAQLLINRSFEEKILELYQQIELSGRRAVHSPDTSSCHEVNATLTDRTSTAPGVSPHSSPLSASLASSEGSMAFLHTDVREMKNLQVIVDQKEPITLKESNNATENVLNQEAGPFQGSSSSTSKKD